MRKNMYRLLFAAAVLLAGTTGCSTEQKAESIDQNVEETIEDLLDADVIEDETESCYYSVEVYGLDEALLYVTTVDESGNRTTEEVGSQGFFGSPGMTIAQLMEEWGITEIEAKCDGYETLGWQAYEYVVQVDSDGFETDSLEELYDGKIFSTEEMMNQELPDKDVYFRSVWNLTCSKCNEEKVCEVYYVDDDCYFICDDCYEAFAKEMGWEESL